MKPIIYYFSASWCNPCRSLTPKVQQWAKELEDIVDFRLVSLDRTPATCEAYANYCNLKPVPYNERQVLQERYNVRTIPNLVLIRPGSMSYTPIKKILMNHGSNALRQLLI